MKRFFWLSQSLRLCALAAALFLFPMACRAVPYQKEGRVSITVSKDDSAKDVDVSVSLKADGKTLSTVTMKKGQIRHVFGPLPRYNADGGEIVYTLSAAANGGKTVVSKVSGSSETTKCVMVHAPEDLKSGRGYFMAVENWFSNAPKPLKDKQYYFLNLNGPATDGNRPLLFDSFVAGLVFRGVHYGGQAVTLGGKTYGEYLNDDFVSDRLNDGYRWIYTDIAGSDKKRLQNAETGDYFTLMGVNQNPLRFSFVGSAKDGWHQQENWGWGVNYSNALDFHPAPNNNIMASISSTQHWGWPTPPQKPKYFHMLWGSTPAVTEVPAHAAQFKFFTPVSEKSLGFILSVTAAPPKTGDGTPYAAVLLLTLASVFLLAALVPKKSSRSV